jgi:maltose alpha-D-glucosyltransferase/alpha-amylase
MSFESRPGATLWYKQAVIYELHVRSFRDSDGSGTGDFVGLTSKLDYIQDLGVDAIWLLPFSPSPWRDDGYDISDFTGIHPAYGTLDDFRRFLDECKRRSLRVITELVVNHTSDEHPWFQRARSSPPGSPWRDYYVWSDTPEKYQGVRIIFSDFESSNWTWDPLAQAFFWHRFYSHQPDLNFDNPEVREAVIETVDFWLAMGVDGLRLDAVPYLFEREGTTCENLPETHAFLRELRTHVEHHYPDAMLLAEANQWPDDAVEYFGGGDECHMAFHFPLMPRLFMATRTEDSFPITNIIEQTPAIPDNCQWATFLRNHDELTLEMVCEDERDYMYRAYAHDPQMRINLGIRRRLAPLLENDRRRIELMNALLLSLPGTPVIYYGDEIGMGEDLCLGDRNGVRTPMQWTSGKNAGFSEAEPDQLFLPVVSDPEYHSSVVNVEAQERKPVSLLWWMRRAITTRRQSDALTNGKIKHLYAENRHVLAFIRHTEKEQVLVVANLSRLSQSVHLRLADYAGNTPVEMFGGVDFAPVKRAEYTITLGPYGYYWFNLQPKPQRAAAGEQQQVATVQVDCIDSVLAWEQRRSLVPVLLPHLRTADPYGERRVTGAEIIDLISFNSRSCLAVIEVRFAGGDPEMQLLPLAVIERNGEQLAERTGETLYALFDGNDGKRAALYGGSHDGAAGNALLELISNQGTWTTRAGQLKGCQVGPLTRLVRTEDVCLLPEADEDEQRNVTVLMGRLYALKMFRRLETGPNPELEAIRFLTQRSEFPFVAPAAGYLEYVTSAGDIAVAGLLRAYVDKRYDLWQYTLHELGLYLERVVTLGRPAPEHERRHPLDFSSAEVEKWNDVIQTYLEQAHVLGRRTAQLHTALASDTELPEFAPEPINAFYVREIHHALASMAQRVFGELRERKRKLTGHAQNDASEVLRIADNIRAVFREIIKLESPGCRIRVHGDLHLGQILHTGEDVIFIDFEGDASQPLANRLRKRSPLVDLAGILFSFRYAAASAAFSKVHASVPLEKQRIDLPAWIHLWQTAVSAVFLQAYRNTLPQTGIVPRSEYDFRRLLDIKVLGQAVYQVAYELQNRADWVPVALRTLLDVYQDVGRETA